MTSDPRDLHKALEAAKVLRRNIASLTDDETAIQDTFDGETTLDLELRAAIIANDEDQIIVDGIKERESELRERRRRAENRIEARRGFIEQAMVLAGWKSQKLDIATVTVLDAPSRVEIDDEAEIPTQFWKRQDPVLDKAGLLSTLRERHSALKDTDKIADEAQRAARIKAIDDLHPPIPGCHLDVGGVSISIRRK